MTLTVDKMSVYDGLLSDGLSIRIRASGTSMAPFITGEEYLTIKRVGPGKIRPGDIVFYRNRAGQGVIHRVVRRSRTPGPEYVFETRGDNLNAPDELVHESMVLGKVVRVESTDPQRDIDMERPLSWVGSYLTRTRLLAARTARLLLSDLKGSLGRLFRD